MILSLPAAAAVVCLTNIRHITQFATWLDGWYVERFGEPPVDGFGARLRDVPRAALRPAPW